MQMIEEKIREFQDLVDLLLLDVITQNRIDLNDNSTYIERVTNKCYNIIGYEYRHPLDIKALSKDNKNINRLETYLTKFNMLDIKSGNIFLILKNINNVREINKKVNFKTFSTLDLYVKYK